MSGLHLDSIDCSPFNRRAPGFPGPCLLFASPTNPPKAGNQITDSPSLPAAASETTDLAPPCRRSRSAGS
jgi:hypothetical protein